MGKEAVVEATDIMEVLTANHQTGARSPQQVIYGIILVIIALYRTEDTATTERIAITVEETSGGTGILKDIMVIIGQEFRLTGGDIGTALHEFKHRREPVVRHLDITVQEDIIVGLDLAQRTVIAASKTIVLIEEQRLHLWELLLKHLHGTVG